MTTQDAGDITVMDDSGEAAYESDLTAEERKEQAKKKAAEEWNRKYRQEKIEQELRIKGVKETAIFRVKGDLYTKVAPQEPRNYDAESEDQFDNRIEAMIEKLMAEAMTRYVTECMKLLTARKNINPDDWRECTGDLYAVKTAVKGVVRSAHGLDYWG